MTHKIALATAISHYETMSIFDVHSANGRYCVSGDRRLRDLAVEFRDRKHAKPYEYRDGFYTFYRGFMSFCGVWARQHKAENKKAS